jgi:hypothetical protein
VLIGAFSTTGRKKAAALAQDLLRASTDGTRNDLLGSFAVTRGDSSVRHWWQKYKTRRENNRRGGWPMCCWRTSSDLSKQLISYLPAAWRLPVSIVRQDAHLRNPPSLEFSRRLPSRWCPSLCVPPPLDRRTLPVPHRNAGGAAPVCSFRAFAETPASNVQLSSTRLGAAGRTPAYPMRQHQSLVLPAPAPAETPRPP